MTRPTRTHARLARYGFGAADGDGGARAADLLGPDGLGLWLPQTQEPAGEGGVELLTALSRAADPDLALRQLHRIVEAERRHHAAADGGSPLLAAMRRDPGLRRRLVAVLGASSALGDHLVANPTHWTVLSTCADQSAPVADGRLRPAPAPGAAGVDPDAPPVWTVAGLREAYRLALLRIAAADLTGGRALEQTMAALSRAGRQHPGRRLRPRRDRAAGRHPRAPARRGGDGQVRRRGAQLRLRRGRDLRGRRGRGPGAGHRDRHPADPHLRAGRLAGRRGAATRGQPGAAGAHPRQPPRLLPALGPHLGVPGAAQGPPGRRRPGAGPGVDRRAGAAGLAGRRAPGGGRGRPRDAAQDHRQHPAEGAGPRDQARPRRAARHRVRGAAAATGARPRRRDAAGTGHHSRAAGPGRRWLRRPRRRRGAAARLPLPARRRAPPATAGACGVRTPCPTDPAALRWLAARARLHRHARAATPSRRSAPSGSPTPPRYAGCTPNCSTGRCWSRWPGCRPTGCG